MNERRVTTIFAEFGAARPTLRRGSSGQDVSDLQEMLNALGFNLEMDGSFGPMTESALRSYQSDHGLAVTGAADSATWSSLGQTGSGGVEVQMGPIQITGRVPAATNTAFPIEWIAGGLLVVGLGIAFLPSSGKKRRRRR